MTKIIISLGSNMLPEQHIDQAVNLLRQAFGELLLTHRLWTEPIGGECSCKFLNLLVMTTTTSSQQQVQKGLKRIEHLCGRKPGDKDKGIVVVDADLLLYNDKRCHMDDWQRDYVKILMKELDDSQADTAASDGTV